MIRACSIVMTRVLDHCDDKGMEHCDDKGMEQCDDKGHGVL